MNDIRNKDIIVLEPDTDRNRGQRKMLSDLRKEGIIFIPIGNFTYKRIEKCDREQIDKYINTQIASMNSQYFSTIKPIKDYMTDEQLKRLHFGGLEL